MEATAMDLRYHFKDILKALERNESVDLFYRGELKGTIVPPTSTSEKTKTQLKDHPFFHMRKGDTRPVEDIINELRKRRYDDL